MEFRRVLFRSALSLAWESYMIACETVEAHEVLRAAEPVTERHNRVALAAALLREAAPGRAAEIDLWGDPHRAWRVLRAPSHTRTPGS